MKKTFFILIKLFVIFSLCYMNLAFAQTGTGERKIEFASSPNPVGSGARAMGMGGAFISVADDATAASWNPGGLIQLEAPEVSFVGNWFYRTEDNAFGTHPEANGQQSVSREDINYFSLTYPFIFLNRSMVISLNYQNLYEFNREWNFNLTYFSGGFVKLVDNIDYYQKGNLSSVGVAYCIDITPEMLGNTQTLSFGFTLNLWDDDLSDNEWEENLYQAGLETIYLPSDPIENYIEYKRTDRYLFSGFNANMGLLWRKLFTGTRQLNIGLVLKLPFTANIKHERTEKIIINNMAQLRSQERDEKLDMPMSYGIGCSYRFSDNFMISADIYRTEWQDYILTDADGKKKSPLTNKTSSESDIDATHQIRIGAEYLLYKPDSQYIIPFRAGLFYDPAPANESPDDYYGITLGTGLERGRFVFDVAYQYRFGNDVGTSIAPDYILTQDVEEHTAYFSCIIRFK